MKKYIFIIVIIFITNISLFSQQWKRSDAPAPYDLWDVVMINKLTGSAVSWDQRSGAVARIITTSNSGKSWSEVLTENNRGAATIDKLDNNNAVALGGANNYLSCWKSNSGASIYNSTMSENEFTMGKPSFWSCDFVNASIGYGGTAGGRILKTTNGGNNWSYLNYSFDKGCIVSISFVNENLGFVALSNADYDQYQGKQLYKTTDGGKTWKNIYSVDVIREVLFQDENVGFLVGAINANPRIWKTKDGGNTWEIVFNSNPEVYWMNGITFTTNKYIGYAVGGQAGTSKEGAIFRTIDGGESWTQEIGNLPTTLTKISFFDETNGVAVGDNGAIYYSERNVEPPFEPEIRLLDSIIDFGFGDTGEELNSDLIIKAKNPAGITITNIEVVNDFTEKGFSLDLTNITLPIKINVGEKFVLKTKFKNDVVGIYNSIIKITSNDKNNPNSIIKVVAEATAPFIPIAKISIVKAEFIDLDYNSKKDLKFKIHSSTSYGLIVKNVKIENNSDNLFTIKTSEKLPYEMFDIDSIEVVLTIDAKKVGEFSTNIIIESSDEKNPIIKIPLTASILAQIVPTSKVLISEIDFLDIETNIEKEKKFKVYSTNSAGLEISNILIENNIDNQFTFSTSKSLPIKLIGQDSLEISVKANISKVGTYNSNLVISTNDNKNQKINIPIKAIAIISGVNGEDNENVQIYPNPISINTNILFNSIENGNMDVNLIDINGFKSQLLINIEIQNGKNLIPININNFSNGNYLIELYINKKYIYKKIIINN